MDIMKFQNIMHTLGISTGDSLLVSSDTRKLILSDINKGGEINLQKYIYVLMEILGEDGTLMFPTYNWDFCRSLPFNYKDTPSMTGAFGKEALRMKSSNGDLLFKRTKHPIYSFAVWGKDSELLYQMDNKTSFSKDSPFAYLHSCAKNLIIDVSLQHSLTFTHYVEEVLDVPYRYQKYFTADYIDETGKVDKRSYSMYVRDLEKDVITLVEPIGEDMHRDGCFSITSEENISFSLLRFSDFYEYARNDILKNNAKKLAQYIGQGEDVSYKMYDLADELFPICRSLTGDGVRQTLKILQKLVPSLTIHEVPTGTQVFDWTVPKEWVIRDAFIKDSLGNTIVSFRKNNLHVLGYATPLDVYMTREELLQIIFTQEDDVDAIPYVTSYYKERHGFCMSEQQKNALLDDRYHVVIDSELKDGSLTYGEILIHGSSKEEIVFSTYICHPSMANNELSGPCLAIYLARKILEQPLKYSYRFVFIPETIGSITYLSKNLEHMKEHTIAGFNLSCVGDNRTYSYIESRYGHTLADKVAKNILKHHYPEYKHYTFLDRGSDERQYCAPGVDLPVCAICRSKYGEYPEYHTSKDDLSVISPAGFGGAYDVYMQCINALENNARYQVTCLCEPQLGKRNLYPNISKKGQYSDVTTMMNLIAYSDGTNDLIDISNIINVPIKNLIPIINKLCKANLLKIV